MSHQRRHARIPVTLLVDHHSSHNGQRHIDYAVDLSRSGIYIQTREPAPAGAAVTLSFAPKKNSQLVHAYGRVARSTGDGVAVEFVQLDKEAQELIEQVVAQASMPAFTAEVVA